MHKCLDPAAGDGGAVGSLAEGGRARKYRRTTKPTGPRTWRTRPDPFADVWDDICHWLAAAPERTAKSVFAELQQRSPGRYPAGQLRTLQRRVKEWRAR